MKTDIDIRKQPIRPADWEMILRTRRFDLGELAEFSAMMAVEVRRISGFLPTASKYFPIFYFSDIPRRTSRKRDIFRARRRKLKA